MDKPVNASVQRKEERWSLEPAGRNTFAKSSYMIAIGTSDVRASGTGTACMLMMETAANEASQRTRD